MGKRLDLTGQKFNRLTAIAPTNLRQGSQIVWEWLCDCGKTCYIGGYSVRSGHTKTCGCYIGCYTNYDDLTGKRFGQLTAISPYDTQNKHKRWQCQCDCGTMAIVSLTHLNSGHTKSCGCITDSIGEGNITRILTENNISFVKEYTFEDLFSDTNTKLRFDFAILDKDHSVIRLIEFDGRQHSLDYTPWNDSESLETRKKRDKIKDNYAINNNIPLVRIPYTKRDNITINDLLQDYFLVKGEEL